jgi:hypothetical protein
VARNVGSIEVTVDADTGKLKGQLAKAGEEGGKAAAKEIDEALDDIDAEIGIEIKQGAIRRVEERINEALDDLLAEVGIDVNDADLRATEAKIDQALDGAEAMVGVDVDSADLEATQARLDQAMDGTTAEVGVSIDAPSKAAADALLKENFDETGAEAGDNFNKSFGGHMSQGKWIALGVATIGDAISSGLSGSIAAATSVVSSAMQALGGSALAATPIIAGLGTALASGLVGAQGFGDALKEVNTEFANAAAEGRPMNLELIKATTAFRNLSPAAQETALAFADIRDELGDLRQQVQQQLFAGMADELRELGETVIPNLADGLSIAADSVNEFGHELAAIAKRTDFKTLIESFDPALDDAFDAAGAFVDTLDPFLRAAAPAAERLAEMIERGAEALRDWVRNNPTEIADFLDDGLTSLKSWSELLASTGDLLATVFKAGADSGDGFVVALNNIIERWDAWLEDSANDDSITSFFESGQDAMAALQPILDGLKEAFHVLVTPETMGNFEELAQAIGDMLPVLAEMITFAGKLQLAEAFANIITVLGPLVDLLNLIPAPLLEIAGTAIVVVSGILKINAALKAFGVVSKMISLTNPYLLAFTAAITVAVFAMEAFKGKSEDVKQRTEELTNALQNNVDAMINSGDAANSAALGMDALDKSIFETGKGGEKLQDAFRDVNEIAGDTVLGIEDTTDVLASLQGTSDDGAAALTGLATKMGLPADAAKELGQIVADTDDNMNIAAASGTVLGNKMTDLAEKTGIPREELVKMFGALEEIQDQAENTDLEKITSEFNRVASSGTEAEQAMLKEAQAGAEAAGMAGDSVEIYKRYVAILNDKKNASDDSAAANLDHASSYELVQQSIDDAIAAHKAEEEALKAERKAAFDAWQDTEKLAAATENAAEQLAVEAGVTAETASGLVDIGNAARDSAAAADALTDAFNILFGVGLTAQEAFDGFYTSINDLKDSLKETGEDALPRVGSALEAVFGTTEAALGFRDAMRGGVEEMLNYATAAVANGEASDTINSNLDAMRLTLIDTGAQFGLSAEEVDGFITSLIGTPELVQTVVTTPGLIDALLNAENLTLLYDDAGNPVITEFEAAGIDPAMASVEGFQGLVEGLNQTTGEPTVQAPTIPTVEGQVDDLQGAADTLDTTTATPTVTIPTASGVQTTIKNLQTDIDKLGRTTATPTIQMPSYSGIKTNVDNLQRAVDRLDTTTGTPTVTMPSIGGVQTKVDTLASSIRNLPDGSANITVSGVQTGIDKVNELRRAIDNLQSKTITVTTVNTQRAGMAGAMIHGPETMQVGERGYSEALIPLQLPLNRVNPEVREMAAMLRGGSSPGQIAPGTGKVVNNYMTITPASADPGAVASQIINRAASLANR